MRRSKRYALICAASAALATTPFAGATDRSWTNRLNNNAWSSSGNWSPSGEPGPFDNLLFPTIVSNPDAFITLSASESCLTMSFNDSYTLSSGSVLVEGGVVITAAGTSTSISSNVGGDSGFNKRGPGTLTLTGSNNTFAALFIEGGTLVANHNVALGGPFANMAFTNGATLRTTQTFTINRNIALSNSGGGRIDADTGTTLSVSGVLSPSANPFTAGGAGTLILQAASTRTGSTSILNGTLRLTNLSALGTGSVSVSDNGTLELGTSGAFAHPVTLNNNGTLRSSGTATASLATVGSGAAARLHGGTSLTVSSLSGGGSGASITTSGGTVTLNSPNSYIGTWNLDPGTLSINSDAALGNATNPVNFNGGTLFPTLGVTSVRNFTVTNAGGTFNASANSASTFANVTGTGNFRKTGGQMLTVNHVRTDSLNVSSGTLAIAQTTGTGHTGTSKVASLTATGKLDLKNNKLIVTGADAIGSWNGTAYTGVTGRIQSGRNNGTWNGNGIITSMSDATTGVLTTLAIATADETGYAGSWFGGQVADPGATLIMYTWGGDADLDGDLDGDDYFQIDSNVADESAHGFFRGDFDYDGDIDGDDYFILDGNIAFAQSQPNFPTGGGLTAVPEPTVLAVMMLGTIPLLRRKRS